MIEKKSDELLDWTNMLVIDTEEAGITTNEEARKFLNSIPQKQRVQDWGFYASRNHYFVTDIFDDIKKALIEGIVSVETCRKICSWNRQAKMEYWNMDDVYGVVLHM